MSHTEEILACALCWHSTSVFASSTQIETMAQSARQEKLSRHAKNVAGLSAAEVRCEMHTIGSCISTLGPPSGNLFGKVVDLLGGSISLQDVSRWSKA